MADDIVKRLRTSVGYRDLASALFESATEIERLRAERDDLQVLLRGRTAEFQTEIERLRADNDELRGDLLMKVHRIGELADEIERLRAEVISMRAERDHTQTQCSHLSDRIIANTAKLARLRTAGDALAAAYRTLGGLDVAHDSALRVWEEARRG